MPITGMFGSYFRAGGSKNTVYELVLNGLLNAKGTAYNVERGSIVWCECATLAKAIAYIWQANKTLSANFDPNQMYAFIDRWVKILNITTVQNETIAGQRAKIEAQFSLFSKPPSPQNVIDLLSILVPKIFITVEYNNPANNQGFFPGGLSVPGGVTLADGDFSSYLNQIIIRIWQPRDHNNNLLMSDGEYQSQQKVFYNFLNNYLPTYVGFRTRRYWTQGPGTITLTTGSGIVSGVGTTFTTTFSIGMPFETVDDLGRVRTYIVAAITDDSTMEVYNVSTYDNTNGYYRINNGFFLDVPSNLDNLEMN